jgi:MFS family permease
VLVILIPINAFLLRHKPGEVDQTLDDVKHATTPRDGFVDKANDVLENDWTLKRAFRSARFWALIIFPFLGIIGIYIVLVHNVKYLVDQGIDKMTAAFIFGLVGVISSIFRIFWGWLSDRIGREQTYTLGIICACIGVGSLLLIEVHASPIFTVSYFIFFGIGWGATAPIFMSTSADLFKGRIFGLIYGFLEAGIGIAGAFGAWVAGFIFDQTQSYRWAFILVMAVLALSCIFIWLAAPRKARI